MDKSAKDLAVARQRYQEFTAAQSSQGQRLLLAVAEARSLPFADAGFDAVICSEVLEHVHDYAPVLREIVRVVKPQGLVAVSVPRAFPEWVCWQLSAAYHQVEGGHVRIFRAGQLRRALETAGLRFIAKHHAHALHVPYWWLKCLFWREEGQPEAWPVAQYRRLLVWDLLQAPRITRLLEWLLNPVMGKSVVMYFAKPGPDDSGEASAHRRSQARDAA